ncbi:uncharacterized protein LOC124912720 [Impatiens glandulifera]|uniref:uncharacterized protein LOC124912720 n=1 Tax=Impatiens glandulifera TaxID=253017 RepID=UPI001FB135CA|nr:uncharacterized protein LOC124912720 [Impatiens glandulifera]
MGNGVSHRPESSSGKVILSDGTIHEYDTQLTAADLMLDHPRHMVVEISHSGKDITVNSKQQHRRPIIPLPADKKLEKEKLYFMMPMKNRGKPASFLLEEIQRLLLRSNYNSNSKNILSSTTGFVPLIVRFICTVRSESEIQSIVQMKNVKGNCLEDKKELMTSSSDEILDDRPEFMSRQFSGRGWKPSLDTIIEKGVKLKVRHWLL